MKRIQLYDTTLRDGSQGEGITLSVEDKLKIAQRLDQFGVDLIEGGWPYSNPKDTEFFRRGKSLGLKKARLAAFGSTRRAGIKAEEDGNLSALVACGAPVAAIFGKSSAFQVTHALRTTLDENLDMIEESVAFLVSKGLEVIYDAEHFFDGFKGDQAYAMATLQAAVRGGAGTVVLCDTNGGSLPQEVASITRTVVEQLAVPVGIHAHNDSGLGVANTLVAVEAGAVHVQGTINGYGERAGNADLCQVIPNLQLKMGCDCVPDLTKLTELARYVDELANVHPNDSQPFVGTSVFAHKGGMHVSALLRHSSTYEHIDPASVGNRRRVLMSELAGGSSVIYKAKEYDINLEKDSPALAEVINTVKELGSEGYTFEGAEGSFELILRKAVGQYRRFFDLVGFRLIIEKRHPSEAPIAEATIKIRIGQRIVHTVSEGNGPVNALDKALRLALEESYPAVRDIQLSDYKVRVLNEKAGTEARVRVLIESTGKGRSWNTVGVSTNIIEASWRSLVDSIEYGLMICDVEPQHAESAVAE